jgi:hypothetical protein
VFGALRDQLADFTTCLRRGGGLGGGRPDDAVEALRIAEAIITAGRMGEVVVLDSGEAWP